MSNKRLYGCINKGIYFKTREEANQFIKSMNEISDTYGFIFCADVLDYFLEDCNISHDRYGWLNTNRWFVHPVGSCTPYVDRPYRVQLDKPILYYSEESKLKTDEVGPAWDGFRAGVSDAEREIHGGFVTIGPEMPWDENKFKKIYEEWIKENPHTDITTLYPKTHFVFPGRSCGKVAFTKAWMNAMYGTPMYSIDNVIFNDPATIVFWSDGTKTVVKTQEGETFDPEKGLAMAISKKALGNKREYYHTFLHWLKKHPVNKYLCMYCGNETTNSAWDHACEECSEDFNKKYDPIQAAYDILAQIQNDSEIPSEKLNDAMRYLHDALED